MIKVFPITLNETLDYGWYWSRYFPNDPLASSIWSVESGLTVITALNDTESTAIFLTPTAGGNVGDRFEGTNKVTTVGGRTAERTFAIEIVEKRYG